MIADRTGEDHPLDVPPDRDQVLGGVGMADPGHVLLDDRALIEVDGHEMGGGPDQLDPSLMRLVVGP